jgi:hypothetical protein
VPSAITPPKQGVKEGAANTMVFIVPAPRKS